MKKKKFTPMEIGRICGILGFCLLLLTGCHNSYVQLEGEGSEWDSFGYQTPAQSTGSRSFPLLPDGTSREDTLLPITPEISGTVSSAKSETVQSLLPAFSTEKPKTDRPSTTTEPVTTTQPVTSPTTTRPDYPDYALNLLEFTDTVEKGHKATLTVQGRPGVEYTIRVRYSSGYSSAKGLEPQISDENGVCSWTWRVGASTKPGSYPITVSDGVNSYSLTFTVQ